MEENPSATHTIQHRTNLTDSDLKIIAMAAYRAGNAETDFMNKAWAKPGGRKDSLNKKIQSSSPEAGSFIARLNKAASALSRGNISKAFNIFTSSPFNGDLSSYYNGNALTLDNIHKIRTKQLASGPSVGVTQMKGSKYIVPIKYQSNPQNSVSSYEQDGINTAYALAKAYQTLRNKRLYYTNSSLNDAQQKNFANNPEKYKVTRGDEIPIMDKHQCLLIYVNRI